jgi:hypothetical protein
MWLDHSRRFPDPHQDPTIVPVLVGVDQRGLGRVVKLHPR